MIIFDIKNQYLSIQQNLVVEKTIDYITAKFSFSKDWDNCVKFIYFVNGCEHYKVEIHNNELQPSDHINLDAGQWIVYIQGDLFESGEVVKRVTTNIATLSVARTGKIEDYSVFPEVTPSVIEQLLAKIGNLETLDTLAKDSVVSAINELANVVKPAYNFEKLSEHLYTGEFYNHDYAKGVEYFEKYKPQVGACSAVIKGNIIGRNYDWKYDNASSFVVRTPAKNNRHAVLGVCSTPTIDHHVDPEHFDVIPFMLLDGINDKGLFCEINVVPAGDNGITIGTHPELEDLPAIMIPRFVLDYADTVDEAIELIESRNIYAARSEAFTEEFHFLLSDRTKAVCIEFVNNEMVVIEDFVEDKPISTNYYLHGYDGTRESLTLHANGIERQSILTQGFNSVQSVDDMISLMKSVWYTNAYDLNQTNPWYSEFNGNWPTYGDLTIYSSIEDYSQIMSDQIEIFLHRERDGGTWQTVHCSTYNRENNSLTVIPQESETEKFVFQLSYPNEQFSENTGSALWESGVGEHSVQTVGSNNNAIGESSVAEGAETDAHSYASHAEGYMTSTGVNADYSHTEGYKTSTQGQASHAEGDNTITNNPAEHAEGRYNKSNMGGTSATNTLHSVGIGNGSGTVPGGERKNAFEIMQNGDTYFNGVGEYDGTNPSSAQSIQTVLSNKENSGKITINGIQYQVAISTTDAGQEGYITFVVEA